MAASICLHTAKNVIMTTDDKGALGGRGDDEKSCLRESTHRGPLLTRLLRVRGLYDTSTCQTRAQVAS
jgi:hypothetical protein